MNINTTGTAPHPTLLNNHQDHDFQQQPSSSEEHQESSGPPLPPATMAATTTTATTIDNGGIQPPRLTGGGPFSNKQWPRQPQQQRATQYSSSNSSSNTNTTSMQPPTMTSTRPGMKNTTAGLRLGVQNSMPNFQKQPATMAEASTHLGPNGAALPTTRDGVAAMQQQQSKNPPFQHQGQNGMATNNTLMQQRTNVTPPFHQGTNATGLPSTFQKSPSGATTNMMPQTTTTPASAVHHGEMNGLPATQDTHVVQMQHQRTNDPSDRFSSLNGVAVTPTNAPGHFGGTTSLFARSTDSNATNNSQGQQQQQHPMIAPARPGGPKAVSLAAQNPFTSTVNTQQAGAQQQQSVLAAAKASSVTPDTRVARASSSSTAEPRGLSENSSILGNRGPATGYVTTPKNNIAGTAAAASSTLTGAGAAATAEETVSFDDLHNELMNEFREFDDRYETYQDSMLNDNVALGAAHAELLLMLAQEMDLCEKIEQGIAMADEVIRIHGLKAAAAGAGRGGGGGGAGCAAAAAGPTTTE
jgi:hypothetical protein